MNEGQTADRPREIPGKGWKDVFLRVKDQFTKDNLDVVSAGVGFYFFLSLFPLMIAMVAIYGLVYDPGQVEQHMDQLTTVLPQQTRSLIEDQLQVLTQEESHGFALVISLALSFWTGSQGTKALFDGINIAYNEESKRSYFMYNVLALSVTLVLLTVGIVCAGIVIGFPAFVGSLGLPDTISSVVSLIRWPLLFAMVILFIGVLYKVAPDRDNPKFRWVSWGACVATALWVSGSLLFSLYVNNFSSYSEIYGSVAAIIILMLWFQLAGLSILLGAEINSELEHQTVKDSTIGEPKPMGTRGAYYADHVAGESEREKKLRENLRKKGKSK